MERLPITQVKPGDRLAEAVCSDSGQTLLSAGVVLTQNKILMLRQRNVLLVNIDTGDDPAIVESAEQSLLSAEELKHLVVSESRRFGDTRKNPVMDALFRAVINRATRGQIG